MNARFRWFLAVSALLASMILCLEPAFAHGERVTGLVLSVLPNRHQVVVRCDAVGTKPEVTTLFVLSPGIEPDSMHPGDRVVAILDEDAKQPTIDELQVKPHQIQNNVHVVVPLSIGDKIPPTEFIDQRGRKFNFGDFHGQFVVLSFVYTRCKDKDECPLVSSHYAVLQKDLANGPYHLVEMTLDPSYDRPPVLTNYGKRYGTDPNRWTLATGDPETVLDFDRRFGLDPFADPNLGLIHTERTVLINPKGYIMDFVDLAGWNPADIVARLRPSDHPASLLDRLDFELSKMTVAICGNGATGYNGLEDLAIILAILGSVGWVMMRLARFIFAK